MSLGIPLGPADKRLYAACVNSAARFANLVLLWLTCATLRTAHPVYQLVVIPPELPFGPFDFAAS